MPVETFGVAGAPPPGQPDQAHGQTGSFTMAGSHADVPPFDVPCWLVVQSSSRTTSRRKRVGKPEVESVTLGTGADLFSSGRLATAASSTSCEPNLNLNLNDGVDKDSMTLHNCEHVIELPLLLRLLQIKWMLQHTSSKTSRVTLSERAN